MTVQRVVDESTRRNLSREQMPALRGRPAGGRGILALVLIQGKRVHLRYPTADDKRLASQESDADLTRQARDPARPPWREDPQDWLTLVDALLEAGREAEARAELAALVEAWPDHPLDPRYQPWLPPVAQTPPR